MAGERAQNLQDTFLNHVRKNKIPAHDLPRQRRQAAGRRDLVRQFLRPAAPRRSFAARLQARHLDDHAGPSGAAVRARRDAPETRPDGDRAPVRPEDDRLRRGSPSRKEDVAAGHRRRSSSGRYLTRESAHAALQGAASHGRGGQHPRAAEARLDEAVGLAAAIDLDVVARRSCRSRRPRPADLSRQGQGRGARRHHPRPRRSASW